MRYLVELAMYFNGAIPMRPQRLLALGYDFLFDSHTMSNHLSCTHPVTYHAHTRTPTHPHTDTKGNSSMPEVATHGVLPENKEARAPRRWFVRKQNIALILRHVLRV